MCLLKHLIIYVFLGVVACRLKLSPEIIESERYVNDTYMVTCIAENSSADISWIGPHGFLNNTKGRVHVELIRNDDGSSELRLVFEKIERQDKGSYVCQQQNIYRSTGVQQPKYSRVSFKLDVVKPISFSMTDDNQNITENRSALIKCEVFGDPVPPVLWLTKGKHLRGPRYKQMPGGLYISNVTLEDEGEYQCRAFQVTARTSNMQTKTINVTVLFKPRWKEPLINISRGYMGGVANLSCEAIGNPPPEYHWTKNGNLLDVNTTTVVNEGKRSVLMVKMADKRVLGQYDCYASNSVNTIRRTIKLEEGTQPSPPASVAVKTVNSSTAEIEVKPPESIDRLLGYRIEFTKVQDNWSTTEYQDVQPDESGNKVIIIDLNENTNYYFRVATRSESGLSNFTDQNTFTTSSALKIVSHMILLILINSFVIIL